MKDKNDYYDDLDIERQKLNLEIRKAEDERRHRQQSLRIQLLGIVLTAIAAFVPLFQSPSQSSNEKVSIVQYIFILIN